MKYILDTHAFIWYAIGDNQLSQKAKDIIDSKQEKYLSIASLWEMSIKVNIGKLTFNEPFKKVIEEQIRINNYIILPISTSHLFHLSNLDLYHRDPFDRLIICQSMIENIPIVTSDDKFNQYPNLQLIWK